MFSVCVPPEISDGFQNERDIAVAAKCFVCAHRRFGLRPDFSRAICGRLLSGHPSSVGPELSLSAERAVGNEQAQSGPERPEGEQEQAPMGLPIQQGLPIGISRQATGQLWMASVYVARRGRHSKATTSKTPIPATPPKV